MTGAALPVSVIAWALLIAWGSGVAVLFVRHGIARRRVELAWRSSEIYSPSLAEKALLGEHRSSNGITPEIATTTAFDVPLTLGGLRPRILLPVECLGLAEESRLLVLAHECAHIARRDLLLGWLPAAAEACFWFHPFARWAVREYGQAREEACDAHALRTVRSSSRSYGELLMHFGVVPRSIVSAASCGSATRGGLLRRLLMLDHSMVVSRFGRIAGACMIVVASASLLPIRLEAGDSDENRDRVKHRSKYENKSKAGPEAKSEPGPAHLTIDRFAYLLVASDGKSSNGAMRDKDGDLARRAQKRLGGEIWWFRLDRTSYALNDPEVMSRVRALYDDQERRWKQQLGPHDERFRLFNDRLESLDRRVERIDDEQRRLEKAREVITDQRGASAESAVDSQLERINDALADLEATREDLSRTREELYRETNAIHRRRESAYREVEAQDYVVFKRKLHAIAEEAVGSGFAEQF